MPESLRSSWIPKDDIRLGSMTPQDIALEKAAFQKHLQIVGRMHRAQFNSLKKRRNATKAVSADVRRRISQSNLIPPPQRTLTFHPLLSRVEDLDHPYFFFFYIAPCQSRFSALIKIAKQLHQELCAEGLENFAKTSGKTGLH